jgi:TRAP-type mannitol/chloroaromatic compound transport system permease large subunit
MADSFVGFITGGLSIVTIITSAFFAAISGSNVATTAAVGGIMVPEMKQRGYNTGYAATVAAAGGVMGVIIPPSLHFGLMVILNLSIGTLTPPLGVCLYTGAMVAKCSVEEVSKRVVPFFLALLVVLALTSYWSDLTMFLPGLMSNGRRRPRPRRPGADYIVFLCHFIILPMIISVWTAKKRAGAFMSRAFAKRAYTPTAWSPPPLWRPAPP